MHVIRSEAVLYRTIGERVRAERGRVGLSQTELARGLRLSRASVSNIEAGRQRFPLHALYMLAEALGCEPQALLPPQESSVESALRGVHPERRRAVESLLPFVKEPERARTPA